MNLAGKRVLLVEDEVIIGFALDDMISDEGAQTTLVASRADAERALAETDYDLAIIDVLRTRVDSIHVLHRAAARNFQS